jgi:hypothetical protein
MKGILTIKGRKHEFDLYINYNASDSEIIKTVKQFNKFISINLVKY